MRDALDPDRITERLATRVLGRRVFVYDRTTSTHDVAARVARDPASHGWVVLAEQQTQGRGRGTHRWVAGRGDSLLGSVILHDTTMAADLLSLSTAVAVADAIGPEVAIKWPNDLWIRRRKVAGILVETRLYPGHQASLVGIGVNCHQRAEDFPPQIAGRAISLDQALGRFVDRCELVRRILVQLEQWLERADKHPDDIIDQWSRRSVLQGRRVTLWYRGEPFVGRCVGIEPRHGLILELDGGGIRVFEAAHSHVDPADAMAEQDGHFP